MIGFFSKFVLSKTTVSFSVRYRWSYVNILYGECVHFSVLKKEWKRLFHYSLMRGLEFRYWLVLIIFVLNIRLFSEKYHFRIMFCKVEDSYFTILYSYDAWVTGIWTWDSSRLMIPKENLVRTWTLMKAFHWLNYYCKNHQRSETHQRSFDTWYWWIPRKHEVYHFVEEGGYNIHWLMICKIVILNSLWQLVQVWTAYTIVCSLLVQYFQSWIVWQSSTILYIIFWGYGWLTEISLVGVPDSPSSVQIITGLKVTMKS